MRSAARSFRPPLDRRQVERELADLAPHVRFSVETEGDEVGVRVLDPDTGRAVRHVPARALLDFRRRMNLVLGSLTGGAGPAARELEGR